MYMLESIQYTVSSQYKLSETWINLIILAQTFTITAFMKHLFAVLLASVLYHVSEANYNENTNETATYQSKH